MRLYKLLKDLPTVKAGAIFKEKIKIDGTRVLKACESGHRHSILVREIDNFDEWFESTSSINWNLKWGDRYWYIDWWGNVNCRNYADAIIDRLNIDNGNVYYTEEECKKAHERELAEVRLRKTSTFEPDFEGKNGGWAVGYNYHLKELVRAEVGYVDYGEPVRYATEEDVEKSIKENRVDWLKYLGIKEWE
nr:MAG TPA: hypothetical protein [Caudoviricetes sp.]